MGPFVKKVQRNKVASPFRKEFESSQWLSSYESCPGRNLHDQDLFNTGLIFDEKLKIFWKLYDSLDLQSIDSGKLRRSIVAAVNRERVVLAHKFQGQLEELTVDEIFVAEEVNGSRLGLPTGGQYNLDDLAASMIDGAILALRQSYERHPGIGKKPEPRQIKGTTILGQLHHVLLSLWEDCSWRGYRAVREGDEVIVSPNDEGEARSCAESLSRYYARISETFIHGFNAWRKLPPDVKARIYANGVQVEVEGFGRMMKFTPRLYRPTTTEPPRSLLLRICGSELYFEAILKIPLPKCHGLNLDQLLKIWEVLYALVDTLSKSLPEDTGPQTINELDKFAPLIPKGPLVELFKDCSGLSHKQCKQAVEFLTFCKEQPEELWARPLVECEKGLVAPVIGCILEGNPLRMIEKWMKLGGLDLGQRGGDFESHCRTAVQNSIKSSEKLKQSGVLPHSYKFRGLTDNPGDIDIVIWIGKTLLIGEIKCNFFPSRGSEKNRHLDEMRTAAGQINRKALFFSDVAQSFYQQNVDTGYTGDLRIVPFILTNLSLGVGMHFDNIPVTDLMILNRYLDVGSMDKFRMIKSDGNATGGYRLHFYDSEEEAGNRVKTYLSDPPQLWHFKDSSKVAANPIVPLSHDDIHWNHVDFIVHIDGEKVRNQTLDQDDPSRFKYRREIL